MTRSENHIFTGLQQDASVSRHRPEYLVDAHNIRITTREGETLLSITNERGPKELVLKSINDTKATIQGTIIGHCVLNDYLVVFTHDSESKQDSIYRIDLLKEEPVCINLYQPTNTTDSLGFSEDYPIEAIGDYESEYIQKVYWTDGLNQPRVINIANAFNSDTPTIYKWNGAFDFVPTLALNEIVTVVKQTAVTGQFPAGVIQYAFTYYNKYGQETNIFHTTPLYCISYYDRGASPEDIVSNAFDITVEKVDSNFDYLRIYSILRTSLDATPICKRVADIALTDGDNKTIHYVDNGTTGSNIDPTTLLYVGGETVIAKSLCAKDGTLFLGNVTIQRPDITDLKSEGFDSMVAGGKVSTDYKPIYVTQVTSGDYVYYNGLNTQAAGFKNREYYRLGFQAQYKTGRWSEPVYIKDYQVNHTSNYPICYNINKETRLDKLIIKYKVPKQLQDLLVGHGYKKIRPVVVFPEIQDRTIICQGVINPTMYTSNYRENEKSLRAQSSWFFRPLYNNTNLDKDTDLDVVYSPKFEGVLDYNEVGDTERPTRQAEIQGTFSSENKFYIDWRTVTLHSPELEFDKSLNTRQLTDLKSAPVGIAYFTKTFSDISIITSTPTISDKGSGFVHKSFVSDESKGLISGLFYDDYLVDDIADKNTIVAWIKQKTPFKWLVYLWNKSGSLNNDFNRPANMGTRTAVLSKKIISNLRYSNTTWKKWPLENVDDINDNILSTRYDPQFFNMNEATLIKLGSEGFYKGNVDTLLIPEHASGQYYCHDYPDNPDDTMITIEGWPENGSTSFDSSKWWTTWYTLKPESKEAESGFFFFNNRENAWNLAKASWLGDSYNALSKQKEPIRMKYKSTPHVVMDLNVNKNNAVLYIFKQWVGTDYGLPIIELYRDYDPNTAFGGLGITAKKANKWLPAGDAVSLVKETIDLCYEYGDTWYSRYDCLKTHAFTPEDENQVVEIGSFLLETHINIDGRYDRNRGQLNNLNMSPTNFNLYNPVYSQKDNFFTYYILDSDFYRLNSFPNQITWSTEKLPGSEVDPWTNITLASLYNMDGSKGQIHALASWNNNLYCFQDTAVNNIIFNARVQMSTSDGTPIEIANNYKMEGKRLVTDGVGCINKFAICATPAALYFLDSSKGHLQAITGNSVIDVSLQKNTTVWASQRDVSLWKPNKFTTKLFYDKIHGDLYIITKDEALCYSEYLGQFVSYMSYENLPIMVNAADKFFCVKSNCLYEMFAGEYNFFFDKYKGYDFTFVSSGKEGNNDLTDIDKIFNNIDFRADKWSDKLGSTLSYECPFNYLRVWNEYQDTGEVLLNHVSNKPSNLKKKFRVWRIQVPRDASNKRDRIRNPWCKITLGASPEYNNSNNGFIQFHDIGVQYFI